MLIGVPVAVILPTHPRVTLPPACSTAAVTQSMFAEALASTGEDVLFFIHGYMVQTKAMFKYTHEMQREFDELVRTLGANPSPSWP